MSLLNDQKPGFIPKLETPVFFNARLSPVFPHPVFLMVNSLETGGSERQFVEMTRALRSDGTPVHLGCLHNKGAFADGLGELSEFHLGGSLYGLQSMRSRWRLQCHLRKLRIAVAHAFDFYTNLTLIPAAKLAGICVVGSHRQLGDLLTRAQFSAQLAVFRLCDRVVCNSRAAAERLLQAGLPDRKVVVIGNALPPEAFAEVTPALARAQGVFRIGMIARMNSEYKNHRGFLRAANLMAKEWSNLEFVLVGDGPLRAELEKEAAQLGLQARVQFLGARRDIPAVLRSFDVSVVPSASESLSNVMLESMAAGVPVVVSAAGGLAEIVDHEKTGLCVSVHAEENGTHRVDVADLALATKRMLSDEEFARNMALAAGQKVRKMFDSETLVRGIREVYQLAISEFQPRCV